LALGILSHSQPVTAMFIGYSFADIS